LTSTCPPGTPCAGRMPRGAIRKEGYIYANSRPGTTRSLRLYMRDLSGLAAYLTTTASSATLRDPNDNQFDESGRYWHLVTAVGGSSGGWVQPYPRPAGILGYLPSPKLIQ